MFEMLGALGSAAIGGLSGMFNRQDQMQIANQNIAAQRDFAQHGLGWRIDDAVAHGLSPLVGAGVTPSNFSPVSVNSSDFGSMGQDVGRAIKAMQNKDERDAHDEEHARQITLQRGELENDLLASKLARENSPAQVGPGAAVPRGWSSMVSGDRSPARSSSGFALEDDRMKSKEESAPGVKRMPLWGVVPLKTHPGRASGQDLENEYGDFAGDVLSAPNVLTDALYTAGQSAPWKKWERFVRRRYPWRPPFSNNGMPQP